VSDNAIPDLDGLQGAHVVNPEAIGNPDIGPIVQVDADMADWLLSLPGSCRACGGLNWHHAQPGCGAE
jgi:hypothetical protein